MKDNYWILHNRLGNDCFLQQQQHQQEKQNLEHKQEQQQQSDRNDERESCNNNNKDLKNLWQKEEQVKQSIPPFQIDNHHQQEIVTNKNKNNNSMNNTSEDESDKIIVTDSTSENRLNFVESLLEKENRGILKIRNDKQQQELKRHIQQQQIVKDENDINLSFCGCGFLGIYHVGVASCFLEYAPQLSMKKVAGSSAGSLVAVAYICGNLQLAYATTDILRTAIDARARALGPFHPSFDINATIREALERGLPDDVHSKASGVLHISLTRVYDGENVIISQFDSKEDVIQAIICSCFIPFWSGLKTPKYKGVTYIDGGFSNNLLILDNKTVSVSPFAGEADICPQDDTFNLLQISISNTSFSLSPENLYRLSHALLPPRPEILSDLCEQGFADGIRFLQRMKLISCTKCLEIRSSLLVAADGGDMEEAFTNEVKMNDTLNLTSSFNENYQHIRLEQQEQKTIEINKGCRRRDSVVSTTSQIHYQRQEQQQREVSVVENCDECFLIRQKALKNPLPKQFSDRIREACDTVNKSLSNWIYSHRPIKYLSYLAAPYYLPMEFSLALVYRCWRQLPSISPEIVNCVYNIVDFLVGIIRRMNARSTSTLLLESSLSWEENAIEYEKKLIRQQVKLPSSTETETETETATTTTTTTTTSSTTTTTSTLTSSPFILSSSSSPSSSSEKEITPIMPTCECCVNCVNNNDCCNINNHNFYSSQDSASTTKTVSSTTTTSLDTSISVKITSDGVCVSKHKNPRSLSSSTNQLHSLEDTFDSIVDVTSNQEARIFAYYFRDAKNRLQVTEIFDFQRAESNISCANNNNINNNFNIYNNSSLTRALDSQEY